jgi:hypothetical protein
MHLIFAGKKAKQSKGAGFEGAKTHILSANPDLLCPDDLILIFLIGKAQ